MCTECLKAESALADRTSPQLDYVSTLISAGLCVGVIAIMAAVIFVVVKLCRSRKSSSNEQYLKDDKNELLEKVEESQVITPAEGEKQNMEKMESNYMNVRVSDKVNGNAQSVPIIQTDDTLNIRGNSGTVEETAVNSDFAMYLNSNEAREAMQASMNGMESKIEHEEDVLRSRGSGDTKISKCVPIKETEAERPKEQQDEPLVPRRRKSSKKNSEGNIHALQMYPNFEKETKTTEEVDVLRCRGHEDPAPDIKVTNIVPQMYSNFEAKDASDGYLTSISANKLRQEVSESQDKPDPGDYLYVDSKAPQPNHTEGLIIPTPDHGTYTNILNAKRNREPSSPPGWYEELHFNRPVHTYHEVESEAV